MAEWFKAPVLKTGVPARVPWVRISPLPPYRQRAAARATLPAFNSKNRTHPARTARRHCGSPAGRRGRSDRRASGRCLGCRCAGRRPSPRNSMSRIRPSKRARSIRLRRGSHADTAVGGRRLVCAQYDGAIGSDGGGDGQQTNQQGEEASHGGKDSKGRHGALLPLP